MARGIGIAAEDLQHFTTEEKVAAARRAGIKLVKPQLYENMTPEERAAPLPRTESSSNSWPCRNCGAGVNWKIDTCLLCGYAREKCTSCNGTGSHDVGSLIGGEMPCGCDDGYYYPPVEVAPLEDPNDCAACGDRPAPKDEDGNPLYPRYTHQTKPPVGVCGMCEKEGIPV
jgi:hypothetical protein